tara:strand:- start:5516 stop:5773 length:258 start_codon:yes stop_codon:yes gene_type:complete
MNTEKNNDCIVLSMDCDKKILEIEGFVRNDDTARVIVSEFSGSNESVILDSVLSESDLVSIQNFFIHLRNDLGTKRIIKKTSHKK